MTQALDPEYRVTYPLVPEDDMGVFCTFTNHAAALNYRREHGTGGWVFLADGVFIPKFIWIICHGVPQRVN